MGVDDQTLNWLLTFGAETGGLVDAQAGLEGVGTAGTEAGAQIAAGMEEAKVATEEVAAAQEGMGAATVAAGEKGSEAFDKLDHHLNKMVMSLFLMQLALKGFEELTKQSAAFQELQASFEDFFSGAIKDLAPTLDFVAKGLSGILSMLGGVLGVVKPIFATIMDSLKAVMDVISADLQAWINIAQGNFRGAFESLKQGGKDALAEFKGNGTQYVEAWNGVVKGFSNGVGIMTGETKVFTKEMAKELDERLKVEKEHNDQVMRARIQTDEEKLKKSFLTATQIKKILDDEATAQITDLKKNAALETKVIDANLQAHVISQTQADNQLLALQQKTASTEIAIHQATAAKKNAIDDAETKAMLQNIQKVTKAGAQAFAQKMQETGSLQEASAAASAAMIEQASQEAAEKIEIYGLEAAGMAFASAPNVYLGAVEAAATLAWYSALAAGVGAVGSAIGGAISPPSSSQGASGSSSASTASASPSAASTASQAASGQAQAAPGPASGGGSGTIIVNLFLDRQPILKIVQEASFNGELQINAGAITGQ